MEYRVVHVGTGEVVAYLNEREMAIAFARQLAADHDYYENYRVVMVQTIYETKQREVDK